MKLAKMICIAAMSGAALATAPAMAQGPYYPGYEYGISPFSTSYNIITSPYYGYQNQTYRFNNYSTYGNYGNYYGSSYNPYYSAGRYSTTHRSSDRRPEHRHSDPSFAKKYNYSYNNDTYGDYSSDRHRSVVQPRTY